MVDFEEKVTKCPAKRIFVLSDISGNSDLYKQRLIIKLRLQVYVQNLKYIYI